MYTGTLIQDLMWKVEQAERRADRRRNSDETELQRIFSLPVPQMDGEQMLAGAA